MRNYLQSLLPRLKQYSKELSDTAAFVEIPWAFLDENGAKVTYIFRRQGDLLVSQQGDVTRGTWEYLPQIQSLLIQAQGRERIYNQALLLDSAIMVLRKDGTEELFALANPDRISDMDIVGYLEGYEKQKVLGNRKEKLATSKVFTAEDGRRIRLVQGPGQEVFSFIGSQVLDENNSLPLGDGCYKLKEAGYNIEVKGGKVVQVEDENDKFTKIVVALISTIVALIAIIFFFLPT